MAVNTTVVELDLLHKQAFTTNLTSGSWYVNFEASYPDIAAELRVGVLRQEILELGSVLWDEAPMQQADNIEDLRANPNRWLYEPSNLYLHGPGSDSPVGHRLLIGLANRFSDRVIPDSSPRLTQGPTIKQHRDPLFFGHFGFETDSIDLINSDGQYDELSLDLQPFGGQSRIWRGTTVTPKQQQLSTGYIETINISRDAVTFDIADRRKLLQRPIGPNSYLLVDYPLMDPNNEGKSIPLIYGACRNVPVVVTNETRETTPSYWSVRYADTSVTGNVGITDVRVDGEQGTISYSNVDEEAGTLRIASADYLEGAEVTVDATGELTNAIDVIQNMITGYTFFRYPADFDEAAWEAARAVAPDIGLCVLQQQPILDLVEEISTSIFALFQVNPDGKFTIRLFERQRTAPANLAISREEILNWDEHEYDPSETISSASVGYDRDWNERPGRELEHFRVLRNFERQVEIIRRTKLQRDGVFQTLLTARQAASDFADTVLSIQGNIIGVVTVVVPIKWSGLQVGQWVYAQIDRPVRSALGWMLCEITGVEVNLQDYVVTLDLRMWDQVTDPRA